MKQSATNQSNLAEGYVSPEARFIDIQVRRVVCLSATTETMGYEDMYKGDSNTERMDLDEFDF